MAVQSAAHFPGSTDGAIPAASSGFVDPFMARARASVVHTRRQVDTGISLVPERHPRLCRPLVFVRPHPKIWYWKIHDLQASTFLFAMIGDSAPLSPETPRGMSMGSTEQTLTRPPMQSLWKEPSNATRGYFPTD